MNRTSAPPTTALTLAAPHSDATVIVHPALPEGPGAGFANALAGGLFREIVLGEHASAMPGLVDVGATYAGNLQGAYSVFATRPEDAQSVLQPDVQDLLARLSADFGPRRQIVLVRRPESVSVRVLAEITDPDKIEAMARLAARAAGH